MTSETKLRIKNMVCSRCIRVVREELESLGFHVENVELGEAVIHDSVTAQKLILIREALLRNGFELLEDRRSQLIESVKNAVIDAVRNPGKIRENYSTYLSKVTGVEYPYLSGLFSSTENITIEQYSILQKIEYIKELILYEEHTLGEIARMLGYSSVSHLSNQFKKVTGLTPSYFRELKNERRKALDEVSRP